MYVWARLAEKSPGKQLIIQVWNTFGKNIDSPLCRVVSIFSVELSDYVDEKWLFKKARKSLSEHWLGLPSSVAMKLLFLRVNIFHFAAVLINERFRNVRRAIKCSVRGLNCEKGWDECENLVLNLYLQEHVRRPVGYFHNFSLKRKKSPLISNLTWLERDSVGNRMTFKACWIPSWSSLFRGLDFNLALILVSCSHKSCETSPQLAPVNTNFSSLCIDTVETRWKGEGKLFCNYYSRTNPKRHLGEKKDLIQLHSLQCRSSSNILIMPLRYIHIIPG